MEEKRSVQSLVKVANTISSSFAKLKFVTITCLIGLFVTAAFCVVYTIYSVTEIGNKIYVLDKVFIF